MRVTRRRLNGKSSTGLILGIALALAGPLGIAVGTYSHPVGTYSHPKPKPTTPPARGSISGTVTDQDGSPVGTCVRAYTAEGSGRSRTESDDITGHYRIEGLATGDYKVLVHSCVDRETYRLQWYGGANSVEDAATVHVRNYFETPGIDVVVERLPAPDVGVTDLSVRKRGPIQTDYGNLPSTHTALEISVDFVNQGDLGTKADIKVWVEGDTFGSQTVAEEYVDITTGSSLHRTYHWNGALTAGDLSVYAQICAPRDPNEHNDTAKVTTFVHAGGTGFGAAGPSLNSISYGNGVTCSYYWYR